VEVTHAAAGLYDERQKVAVSLSKALETDELFGLGMNEEYKDISFGLYASADLTALDGSVIPAGGLLEVVSIDPNEAGGYGASFASDLPFGSYYVKERTTNSAYILPDTEYPVVFEYAGQEAALVQVLVNEGGAVPNDLLRGRVDGVKTGENPDGGEDVKLAGAVMGLFKPDTEEFTGENALLTVTTGEDGSFVFENIPYGHWIVKEISSPALYTVSPEQHHIYIGVDGQSIKIKVENTLIRGSVQVMKTEAVDEPSSVEKKDKDNNTFLRFLSGAVFDLYEDANGNKEFDSEDTKIGTLKESDAGYHTAENLLAKGYFVKESKAPEGYQMDENAYYFEITEDGQVAVVENGEAGRGFTNEAYRGNLKITKDSSDGRKDGFAFEVKNADGSYCETFTSPKSGVIEVKGLRVGIYTVTEISNRASRDYIIPDAATVEVKADETAMVQFFNEKPEKPETPDSPDNPKTPSNPSTPSTPSNPGKAVPQTGDDNFIFLYGGLLALAVIGGGLSAAAYFKKGKHGRNTARAKTTCIAVLSLCGLLALGSGFLIVRDLSQYAESAGTYDGLAEHVEVPEQAGEPEEPGAEEETGREDSSAVLPVVDFEALRENGPDIIGWLSLPDTAINYPVTQTDNNEYYLHHLYDGTYNKVGCLFADYENQADFSDRNTIIYGHNMRDGSMFAALNEYGEQGYYDGHPQMYLVTPGGGYTMEIFTTFVAEPGESGSDTSPWRLSWKDDGAYTTWLSEMAGRSVIETDVTVTSSDKVLTLSTCTPGGKSRFIVMGKLASVND
jgi:SrtB family sortase